MSSFLDKLLSPSIRRDIGAMGVRGDADYKTMTSLDKVGQWYDSLDIQQIKDWDDLSGSMKNVIEELATQQKTLEDFSQDDLMGFAEELGFNAWEAITNPSFYGEMNDLFNSYQDMDPSDFEGDIGPSQITSPESFGGIGFNPLSRESILENLPDVGQKYREGEYEGNAQNLLESVKPLTMDQIRKTTTGFYNPYIEKEKQPLVDRLIDKRKTATALGGDFAGYGQREQYQDIAEGSFMSGVENIYSDVDAARASALDDLYGTIASWQDVGEIA